MMLLTTISFHVLSISLLTVMKSFDEVESIINDSIYIIKF